LFIWNFAHQAHHLVKLTCKGAQWEFDPLQETAMDNLKQALLTSLALQPINYKSDAPGILSIDTSHIAIGFILSQCDLDNVKLRYHAHFRSITLNKQESQFS
jgi:hypothetical protein